MALLRDPRLLIYDNPYEDPGEPTIPPAPPAAPPGGDDNGQVSPWPIPPTPPEGGGGGGGGGGNGAGGPIFNIPGAPRFTPPAFVGPSFEAAQNEPGYQFRLQSGSDALERSAAARGVLRTGGTLKDLLEYGQNFASQEYGQVYNRALSGYDRLYQGAKDAFAPQLAEWMMRSKAEWERALAAYGRGGGGGGGYVEPPPSYEDFMRQYQY